jgi:hypothetical protein
MGLKKKHRKFVNIISPELVIYTCEVPPIRYLNILYFLHFPVICRFSYPQKNLQPLLFQANITKKYSGIIILQNRILFILSKEIVCLSLAKLRTKSM